MRKYLLRPSGQGSIRGLFSASERERGRKREPNFLRFCDAIEWADADGFGYGYSNGFTLRSLMPNSWRTMRVCLA